MLTKNSQIDKIYIKQLPSKTPRLSALLSAGVSIATSKKMDETITCFPKENTTTEDETWFVPEYNNFRVDIEIMKTPVS